MGCGSSAPTPAGPPVQIHLERHFARPPSLIGAASAPASSPPPPTSSLSLPAASSAILGDDDSTPVGGASAPASFPPPPTSSTPLPAAPSAILGGDEPIVLGEMSFLWLPFFSTREARLLRLVSKSLCLGVAAHPWRDSSVACSSFQRHRLCFPRARAVAFETAPPSALLEAREFRADLTGAELSGMAAAATPGVLDWRLGLFPFDASAVAPLASLAVSRGGATQLFEPLDHRFAGSAVCGLQELSIGSICEASDLAPVLAALRGSLRVLKVTLTGPVPRTDDRGLLVDLGCFGAAALPHLEALSLSLDPPDHSFASIRGHLGLRAEALKSLTLSPRVVVDRQTFGEEDAPDGGAFLRSLKKLAFVFDARLDPFRGGELIESLCNLTELEIGGSRSITDRDLQGLVAPLRRLGVSNCPHLTTAVLTAGCPPLCETLESLDITGSMVGTLPALPRLQELAVSLDSSTPSLAGIRFPRRLRLNLSYGRALDDDEIFAVAARVVHLDVLSYQRTFVKPSTFAALQAVLSIPHLQLGRSDWSLPFGGGGGAWREASPIPGGVSFEAAFTLSNLRAEEGAPLSPVLLALAVALRCKEEKEGAGCCNGSGGGSKQRVAEDGAGVAGLLLASPAPQMGAGVVLDAALSAAAAPAEEQAPLAYGDLVRLLPYASSYGALGDPDAGSIGIVLWRESRYQYQPQPSHVKVRVRLVEKRSGSGGDGRGSSDASCSLPAAVEVASVSPPAFPSPREQADAVDCDAESYYDEGALRRIGAAELLGAGDFVRFAEQNGALRGAARHVALVVDSTADGLLLAPLQGRVGEYALSSLRAFIPPKRRVNEVDEDGGATAEAEVPPPLCMGSLVQLAPDASHDGVLGRPDEGFVGVLLPRSASQAGGGDFVAVCRTTVVTDGEAQRTVCFLENSEMARCTLEVHRPGRRMRARVAQLVRLQRSPLLPADIVFPALDEPSATASPADRQPPFHWSVVPHFRAGGRGPQRYPHYDGEAGDIIHEVPHEKCATCGSCRSVIEFHSSAFSDDNRDWYNMPRAWPRDVYAAGACHYCTDLNALLAPGRADSIFGADSRIEAIIRAWSRKDRVADALARLPGAAVPSSAEQLFQLIAPNGHHGRFISSFPDCVRELGLPMDDKGAFCIHGRQHCTTHWTCCGSSQRLGPCTHGYPLEMW